MDFDFLNSQAETEVKQPPLIPEVLGEDGLPGRGPNLTEVSGMTRKKFTQGVLNVYQALGGDAWLLQQAAIDPKSFIEMLKKLIPTNVNLDQMDGFEITLIDRYGNKAEISRRMDQAETKGISPRAVELGPKPSQDSANEKPGVEVFLTETFTPVTRPTLLSDNSPEDKDESLFDFTM